MASIRAAWARLKAVDEVSSRKRGCRRTRPLPSRENSRQEQARASPTAGRIRRPASTRMRGFRCAIVWLRAALRAHDAVSQSMTRLFPESAITRWRPQADTP